MTKLGLLCAITVLVFCSLCQPGVVASSKDSSSWFKLALKLKCSKCVTHSLDQATSKKLKRRRMRKIMMRKIKEMREALLQMRKRPRPRVG